MRHGETFWNTEGRLQGQTDIPLNEEGRRMAVSCGQGMKEIPVDLCISSPLCRATETAELVLQENASYGVRCRETAEAVRKELEKKKLCYAGALENAFFPDAPETSEAWNREVRYVEKAGIVYYTDARLKEACFGPWEGLICKAEGYNVPLEDFSVYWNDPDSPLIQEGVEHLTHVTERVAAAFRQFTSLKCLKDKTVLLVVHGCVMRSVMYLMSGGRGFHGKIPLNCEIIEAEPVGENGLRELGRQICYDRSMIHDYYATMKQE